MGLLSENGGKTVYSMSSPILASLLFMYNELGGDTQHE